MEMWEREKERKDGIEGLDDKKKREMVEKKKEGDDGDFKDFILNISLKRRLFMKEASLVLNLQYSCNIKTLPL